MGMEIGDLMRIDIAGAVWWFKLSFGEYRKLTEEIQKLVEAEEQDKLVDKQLKIVRDKVVRVDGLTKGGKPVEWDPKMLEEFNPIQVRRILRAIASLEDEDEEGNPTKETSVE